MKMTMVLLGFCAFSLLMVRGAIAEDAPIWPGEMAEKCVSNPENIQEMADDIRKVSKKERELIINVAIKCEIRNIVIGDDEINSCRESMDNWRLRFEDSKFFRMLDKCMRRVIIDYGYYAISIRFYESSLRAASQFRELGMTKRAAESLQNATEHRSKIRKNRNSTNRTISAIKLSLRLSHSN